MTSLVRSLTAAADSPILDGAAISESMSASGIALVSLRNTSLTAVEGTIQIANVNNYLYVAGGQRFITFEQGRFELNINRDNGPVVIELLSPEIVDYLNALMAPIATGEDLEKSEYLDLVTSFYNRAISNEIAGSRIHVSIEFPGNITNVSGGTFSGRRADFDIPLVDFLVLETPLNYEVRWR
jgi:hypothetical protein